MRVEKTDEFHKWIDSVGDRSARARILVRVERLVQGHPGDHRNLTSGLSELRIDVGPGYRVYFARFGTRLLLLLGGGDKSTQQKDIDKAKRLLKNFVE